MQTQPQPALSSPPRVFQYSLDWRFLLPISDSAKIRVVAEEDRELGEALDQIGISVFNPLSTADVKQIETSIYSLVLPFGLPVRWVGANQQDQVEFFRSLRGFIDSNGYLLIGFHNSFYFGSTARANYHSSTPRRIGDQLHQAGFKVLKVLGALPNLSIPEYIFDLNAQAIRFALQHRFRRKPALLKMLQRSSRILGWSRMSNFLPSYFAVAAV